eukprot:4517525-Amphidinium_carterae.1
MPYSVVRSSTLRLCKCCMQGLEVAHLISKPFMSKITNLGISVSSCLPPTQLRRDVLLLPQKNPKPQEAIFPLSNGCPKGQANQQRDAS